MKILVFFLILFSLTIFVADIFAQGTTTGGNPANTFQITRPATGFGIDISGGAGGGIIGNVGVVLKNAITLFFTVGALGFIVMILWGAVDWILSGGDKEKIAGARKRITTAITGLVLLSLSFIIILAAGQILGIDALQFGDFKIPGLGAP